jgi:high frequency lysogenization protein
MNEERVLALAGLFQALSLVRSLATEGSCDTNALETSLSSVLRIDAASTAEIFGGNGGVRLGLRALVAQLDDGRPDTALTRMALTVLRLERRLMAHADLLTRLQEGLRSTQRQADHFGITHATVVGRLAELYAGTLSTLRPRVLVTGSPLHLNQPAQVERIRACLLAAVRSAVLWRQLGGRSWRLILHRRQVAMLARGMLARASLDVG